MLVLKDMLSSFLGLDNTSSGAMDLADQDDFGFSQTASLDGSHDRPSLNSCTRHGLETIVSFLSVVPVLQTLTDEPSREKGLVDLFLECEDDYFVSTLDTLLHNVRLGVLALSTKQLESFLERFEAILMSYRFSSNEAAQLLAIHFLDSTTQIWTQHPIAKTSPTDQVSQLCHWLLQRIRRETAPAWRFREQLARFLVHYLQNDPFETLLKVDGDDDLSTEDTPVDILQLLNGDPDIRVRMRAATCTAHLLHVAHLRSPDPSHMYKGIRDHLCVDVNR